jgi:F-type H+-transporting ATPase subunit epsilon
MPEKSYNLEIVTPRKIAFSNRVQSFTAPGSMGSFQVLHDHAPLLSSTAIGEVKVVDHAGNTLRFATSGGFVQVLSNRVTMLAETAERSDEIDTARAEAARDRALKRLAGKEADIDIVRARLALARALNRLRVAGRS